MISDNAIEEINIKTRENVVTQERNDTNISGKNKLENFNKDTGNMR